MKMSRTFEDCVNEASKFKTAGRFQLAGFGFGDEGAVARIKYENSKTISDCNGQELVLTDLQLAVLCDLAEDKKEHDYLLEVHNALRALDEANMPMREAAALACDVHTDPESYISPSYSLHYLNTFQKAVYRLYAEDYRQTLSRSPKTGDPDKPKP